MPTLTTSLKFITSIFLTMILIALITNREIIPHGKKTNTSSSLAPPEMVTREISDLPPQNGTPGAQPSSNEVTAPQKNTGEILTPYETMHEGASDTDESYQPVISPCTTSMGYKIGTFDNRFGIPKEVFLEEINRAAELWGGAFGKSLLHYDEQGTLTINLIYDDRQARTEDVIYLALEIENSKQAAEEIKQAYEIEKNTYLTEESRLLQDGEVFQIKNKAYAEKVEAYNQKGGATKAEFDEMALTLEELKKEATSLDARREELTLLVDSVNKKVAKHNDLVAYINGLIRKSNSLGAKKFTEGKFSSKNNTIEIYQYSNLTKLRRVIAHELGHALGISKHTQNIASIMYSVNTADTTTLSKEDIEALREVCSSY